jgi:hypothetical protein
MTTRPFVDLPFGPYVPDFGGMPSSDLGAYLTDCINLRQTPNGYRGLPSFVDTGAGTIGSGTPIGQGFLSFTPASGRYYFAIANSKLYQSQTLSSWADNTPVSNAITQYTQLALYDDYLIAVDQNGISYKTLTAAVGTDFSALPGSPPNARVGARVRQHFVLGALVADNEAAVRWCDIGNPLSWSTPGSAAALAAEAGRQNLSGEYGRVRQILGGEKFGVVVQEFALTRMTYVGGSSVFEFDPYEVLNGSGAVNTSDGAGYPPFVRLGESRWMSVNERGVLLTDGYSVRFVSTGRIEAALFLNILSHPSGGVSVPRRAALDPRRRLVIFTTKVGSGSNQNLVYSLDTDSFSFLQDANCYSVFSGPASDLDFSGVVYSITAARSLYSLTGATGTIALQTGYLELDPGYKVQLTGAHLLGAGVPGNLTLSHKSTSSLASVDVVQTGFTTMTANPRGMKSSDRTTEQFHAFRVTGTGSEAQLIKGIRVYFERGEPAT